MIARPRFPTWLAVATRGSLSVLLAAAFALGAWHMDRWSIGVSSDAYRAPFPVMANAAVGLLFGLGLFIFTRRLFFSFLIAFAVQALLYKASVVKLDILESPLALEDAYFLSSINLATIQLFWTYIGNSSALWVCILAGAALLAVTFLLEKPWFRHASWFRLAAAAVVVAATALLITGQRPWSDAYTKEKIRPSRFGMTAAILHSGLMSSLVYKHLDTVNKTFPVDTAALRRVAAELSPPSIPTHSLAPSRRPDIIVVLSESFFDPRILKGMDTLEDAVPNVRHWIDAGHGGYMYVPTYGGGTVRTEFEILTGMPMYAFDGAGFPYMDMNIKETPSLPAMLSRHGYRTLAIHGNSGAFWNRINVYKGMGFDRFLTAKEFRDNGKKDGLWYSDESMTDLLLAELDAGQAPLFAFTISMENHGPYSTPAPVRRMEDWKQTPVPEGLPEQTQRELRNSLYHLGNADTQFGRLLDALQRRNRPFVLFFFGDHLPALKSAYGSLGFMDGKPARLHGSPWVMIQGNGGAITQDPSEIAYSWQVAPELAARAGVYDPYFEFVHGLTAHATAAELKNADSAYGKGLTAAARARLTDSFEKRAEPTGK